jgi:hypothetical protein
MIQKNYAEDNKGMTQDCSPQIEDMEQNLPLTTDEVVHWLMSREIGIPCSKITRSESSSTSGH